MQWEQLTSPDFARMAEETRVCVVSMGVLEKHGEHLPLGTDFLNGHKIACLATERESAVVFPYFYFGQIFEARCFPGTIAINPKLLIELIEEVFDEIARNGFNKIIVYNWHGGNWNLLKFINQCALWERKKYNVYLYMENVVDDVMQVVCTPMGHACEWETSVTLSHAPELVRMDKIPEEPSLPLNKLKDMPFTNCCVNWYSLYPEHYAGDARLASIEKGKLLLDIHVNALASYIASVKSDQIVSKLTDEFYSRVKEVGYTDSDK